MITLFGRDAETAELARLIDEAAIAGQAIVLGPGANGVAAGEEVYGLIEFDRDGAAAEFVTVPAAHLAAKPASVSHAEAATLPLAALTAWQALVDYAALEPGERVLVQGGAGGVGGYVVQLAAILGGDVTATGRAEDRDFVHAMFFVVTPDAVELARLAALADEGKLRPVLSEAYALSDGRQAFESVTRPRPPGKTVLSIR